MKRIAAVFVVAGFLCGLIGIAHAAAPPGSRPVKLKGKLEVLYADDFERRTAKKLYRLKERRSGRLYDLEPSGELPDDLMTGATVIVKGKAKGRKVYLEANGTTAVTTVLPAVATVAGVQKTMVVIANFQDSAVSCAATAVESRVFTDPLNKSVDDLYRETSFGNIWLEGGVFGPFAIPYSTTSACDIYAWANAADAAAAAAGVNVGAYTRKVYVMPSNNPCGYVGIGNVGGSPSRAWVFRCELSDIVAHEMGHNLGMGHSSTPSNTYGDNSDIMGYSGLALRQINAPHQKQTGWLASSQFQPVSVGGTYTVAPMELQPYETTSPQVLTLAKPDTGDTYYLSYRQPIGFDANLSSGYRSGISVHKYRGGSSQTYLMASLADGGVFTDAINGITITQVGHDAQAATVQVQLESGPVCTPSAPVVTIAPAQQSGMAGETRDYLVSVSNPDSSECQDTAFSLSAVLPDGWAGSASPSSLTLLPGATGSAVLTVASPGTAVASDYTVAALAAVTGGSSNSGSATATYTVVPDTVPPTPPANLMAKPGRGLIGLSWLASTDNVKVAGYQILRNGAILKTIATTSYTDRAVVSGTSYTYEVTALDLANNKSNASNQASAIATRSGSKTR